MVSSSWNVSQGTTRIYILDLPTLRPDILEAVKRVLGMSPVVIWDVV